MRVSLGSMHRSMTSPEPDPIEAFVRKAGAELEEAYRAEGVPLPNGLTGEQIARWAIEDMRRDNERWAPEFQRLDQEVRAELSPSASKEEYLARLSAKLHDWIRHHPPEPRE